MTTLLWKELRQNGLTVTLIPLALMAFIALTSLTRYNSLVPIYVPVFCAIFSALIGASMFAPEHSSGTSRFLDYQPVKKMSIWTAKLLFGACAVTTAVALVFLEAMAVSGDSIVRATSSRWTWIFVASSVCLFLFSSSFFYSSLVNNSILAVLLGAVSLCPSILLGHIADVFLFPYYRDSLPRSVYGEILVALSAGPFVLFFFGYSIWSVVMEQAVRASSVRRVFMGLAPIGTYGFMVVCVGLYSYLDWGFVSPSEVWSVGAVRASPDGGKIAFSVGGPYGPNRVGRIWALDIQSGDLRKLTRFRGSAYGPVSGSPWSRDGRSLLYCVDSRSTIKMFLSELDFPLVNANEWSKSSIYIADIGDGRAARISDPLLVQSLKWRGNEGIVFSALEGQNERTIGEGADECAEGVYTWSRKSGRRREFQIGIGTGRPPTSFIVGWRDCDPIVALYDAPNAREGWVLSELRVYEDDAYRAHKIGGEWSVAFAGGPFGAPRRISPDGRKLILHGAPSKIGARRPSELAIFDLLTGELKVAAMTPRRPDSPDRVSGAVFSSDSKWFSFISAGNGVTRVWLLDVEACQASVCLETAEAGRAPLLRFSPGSSRLIVVGGRGISRKDNVVRRPRRLWLVDPSACAAKRILADLESGPLDLQSDVRSVDWLSEDRIVFSTDRREIWTVNLDGSNLRRVFPPEG